MSYDAKKLDRFPARPGVYIMKDVSGVVLYVGKANNLKQRVKQYFVPGRDGRVMVPFLVGRIEDIDIVVVNSEKEALLLENNLIKQHQPHYNALLKDDKSYIALKISNKDEWPTVKLVRYKGVPEPDGLYFGPYTSAQAARQTLDLLNRLFPLRQCSDQEFARRKRPCLLYQMKRCIGPCSGSCDKAEYNLHLARTIKFLKGQDKEILKELHEEMNRFSEELNFEQAAAVYKAIQHLERTIEAQHVDHLLGTDADALGVYRQGNEVILSRLVFRAGRLMGSYNFDFHDIAEDDPELFTSFIMQQYNGKIEIPDEILVPIELPDREAVEEVLSVNRKSKVILHTPRRGDKKALIDLAHNNAKANFDKEKDKELLRGKILLELHDLLSLSNYPHRIECFDNSHIAGTTSVSALIAFTDGLHDKRRYRTYHLDSGSKADDYASMREVLLRRYKRAKEENDLPDLLIVDGGKGQLHVALQVFDELNIIGVDVIGLAKEEGRHDKGMTCEQIFLPGSSDPVLLNKTSPVLFLLQNIRDEAHRFVTNFHRKARSKKVFHSLLSDIPGIGPAKKKALLLHFGSLKSIRQATEEELRKVKGITAANAAVIYAFFRE